MKTVGTGSDEALEPRMCYPGSLQDCYLKGRELGGGGEEEDQDEEQNKRMGWGGGGWGEKQVEGKGSVLIQMLSPAD